MSPLRRDFLRTAAGATLAASAVSLLPIATADAAPAVTTVTPVTSASAPFLPLPVTGTFDQPAVLTPIAAGALMEALPVLAQLLRLQPAAMMGRLGQPVDHEDDFDEWVAEFGAEVAEGMQAADRADTRANAEDAAQALERWAEELHAAPEGWVAPGLYELRCLSTTYTVRVETPQPEAGGITCTGRETFHRAQARNLVRIGD